MSVRSSSERNSRRPRVGGRPSGPSPTSTESPVDDEFSGVNEDFLRPQIGTDLSPEQLERSVLTPVIAEEGDLNNSATKQKLSFDDSSHNLGVLGQHNTAYLAPSIGSVQRQNILAKSPISTRKSRRSLPIDAGWSWLVLAASTVAGFISLGMVFAFGAYFVYFDDYFKDASEGSIAVLYGFFGLQFIVAPFASTLADHPRIGYRWTVVGGGLLTAIGYGSSFFATRLWHLYITLGIIVSTGNGLVYAPSIGIVGHYFERHKYFASTLVTVGSALGIFAFPPLFTFTADYYGWHGSMLINSAIAANMCVCGMVYADPRRNLARKLSSPTPNDPEGRHHSNNNKSEHVAPTSSSVPIITAHNNNITEHTAGTLSPVRADPFHLYLLRDPLFLSILLYALFASSYTNFLYFGTRMYEAHFNVAAGERQKAAWLLSLFGIGNVISRILNALANINQTFADKYWNRMRLAEVCTILLAFAHIYIYYAGTYLELQLFAALIGLCWGFILSSWPGMLIDLFGRQVLSITWGRMLLFCGLFRIILVPISGWLLNVAGNFAGPFYLASVSQIVALLLLIYIDLKQRKRAARGAHKNADEMVPVNVPRHHHDLSASALAPGVDRYGGGTGPKVSPQSQKLNGKNSSAESQHDGAERVNIQVTRTITSEVPSTPPAKSPPYTFEDTHDNNSVDGDMDDADVGEQPTIDVGEHSDIIAAGAPAVAGGDEAKVLPLTGGRH